jgi:predicted DNA-binding transcriptional regulator AlpA
MNLKLKIIRDLFVGIVNRIDNGDCNIEENESDEIISILKKYTEKDERLSKYQACEYLHMSRATFDNYISKGKIPKGTHKQGFKELSWSAKDLMCFKENSKKIRS